MFFGFGCGVLGRCAVVVLVVEREVFWVEDEVEILGECCCERVE